jgi:hypothetical protein
VDDGIWHIIDILSIYDIVNFEKWSRIEVSMTSRAVLTTIEKKIGDIRKPNKRPKSKGLGSSSSYRKRMLDFNQR